jgi:hypothetical protein
MQAEACEPEPLSLQPGMVQISDQITEWLGCYKTCRIVVGHPPRRLFATQMAGQYYRFSRLLPTRTAALKLADRLGELAEHVLLTTAEPMHQVADQGAYVVWLRQPGAQLAESESG